MLSCDRKHQVDVLQRKGLLLLVGKEVPAGQPAAVEQDRDAVFVGLAFWGHGRVSMSKTVRCVSKRVGSILRLVAEVAQGRMCRLCSSAYNASQTVVKGGATTMATAIGPSPAEDATPVDLLLTHGRVITMDDQRRILRDGAIAVDEGRIVAVGPSSEVAPSVRAAREAGPQGSTRAPRLCRRPRASHSPARSGGAARLLR